MTKSDLHLMLRKWTQEYKFHPVRRWRFDYALPDKKIAVEYEGVVKTKNGKSRHTTLTGYTNDCEKYNAAQALGWCVLRYTALSDAGKAYDEIQGIIDGQ